MKRTAAISPPPVPVQLKLVICAPLGIAALIDSLVQEAPEDEFDALWDWVGDAELDESELPEHAPSAATAATDPTSTRPLLRRFPTITFPPCGDQFVAEMD